MKTYRVQILSGYSGDKPQEWVTHSMVKGWAEAWTEADKLCQGGRCRVRVVGENYEVF